LVFTAKPPPPIAKSPAAAGVKPVSDGGFKPGGTMVFGAVSATGMPVPSANPGQSQPKANSTIIFGSNTGPAAPGSATAPTDPGQAANKGSATMVFGAVSPSGLPAVQPKPNSTLLFGPGGVQPVTAPPAATNPTPAANPNVKPSSTMMFGAVGSPNPAAPVSPAANNKANTMMFGAIGKTEAPPAANAGSKAVQTVTFGAPAVASANAKPNATMMFGAVGATGQQMPGPTPTPTQTPVQPQSNPQLQPKPGGSTVMFGLTGPGAPQATPTPASIPAAGKPNATMVFGALPSSPTPTQTPASPLNPAVPARPNATMMFGAGSITPTAPTPTPVSIPAANPAVSRGNASSTMMFGALPADAGQTAPTPTPTPTPSAPQPASTASTAPMPSAQLKPNATMMFGALGPDVGTKTPAQGAPAVSNQTPPPVELTQPKSPSSTMMFGAPNQAATPRPNSSPMVDMGDLQRPGMKTLPATADDLPPNVEPEPQPLVDNLAPNPYAEPPVTVPADPVPAKAKPQRGLTMEMEAFSKKMERRNSRIVWAIVGVLGLGGAAFGYNWWTHRVLPPPTEKVVQAHVLLLQLQKDDTASIEAARAGFAQLAQGAPNNFVAPLGGQLIALSLEAADLRDQIQVLQDRAGVIDHEIKKLEGGGPDKPADWRNRVDGLKAQFLQLKNTLDPMIDQVAKLDENQNGLLAAIKAAQKDLEGPQPDLDRALGIYYATKGDEKGLKFADRYRKDLDEAGHEMGDHDGWAHLIAAEVANRPRVPDEMLQKAVTEAEAAQKANPELRRAKRTEAQLQLGLRNYAVARTLAQRLQTDAKDVATQQLLAQIDEAEKASKAAPAPAPAPNP
jgi:hypothetical protein